MASPKLRFKEFDGDWKQQNLGDCFSLISGYAFPSTSSVDSGAKWLKIADVGIQEMTPNNPSYLPLDYLDKYSQFIVKKNDYVIALTRPILSKKLKIAQVGNLYDGALLNQRVAKIHSKNNNLDFIYSLLQKSKTVEELENSIAGTDPPNLSLNDIKEIKLAFPSKEEQTKIASFLSAVDEKISQLTQKHELLSQYKQGMMQKLFSQQIRFKADDGREFGEWEKAKTGDITETIFGYPFDSKEMVEDNNGIPLMRGINIGERHIRHSHELDRFFLKNTSKLKKYFVKVNDIVLSMDGSKVGRNSAFVTEKDAGSLLVQRVCILREKENTNIQYVYQWVISKEFHRYVDQVKTSSGIPHISGKQIQDYEIGYPCLEEQTKIANFLSAIDQKIEVVAKQIEQAKQWKKGLLQQMFV